MSAEDQARLQTAATATITGVEKSLLWPLQKRSFECSAGCFGKHSESTSLQNCIQGCQQKPQVASQLVQAEVQDFQSRIQRAMQACQDRAQDVMKDTGNESK
jgi:hypothetical protein